VCPDAGYLPTFAFPLGPRAVLGLGLIAIGFVSNMDPLPEVVDGIRAIMLFVPAAACALAAGIFYFGYKLEDGRIRHMQEEISERRSRQQPADL
jgi:Na+/melibiose symporter-like transporter